jgi:hypothetical protein
MEMNKKNSILTIALVLVTLVLGGLSFYIAMQLSQPSDEVIQEETKPADLSYKKDLTLNQISPTSSVSTRSGVLDDQVSASMSPSKVSSQNAEISKTSSGSTATGLRLTPTRTLLSSMISPTKIPTPTYSLYPTNSYTGKSNSTISPTGINVVTTPIVTSTLARMALSGTVSPSTSVTMKPTVNSLPSAGMFNTTLIIFAAAISMIFFSFLL